MAAGSFELDAHQALVVREFIEANWGMFVSHAAPFADGDCEPEEFANQILVSLGGEE